MMISRKVRNWLENCVLSTRFNLPLVLALAICSIRMALPVQAQEDLAEQEEAAIRAAVQIVAPSVVKIETIGGLESVGGVLVSTGPTTGLVVADDGYVVSSSFNFVQQPSSILVTLRPQPDAGTAEGEHE